MANGIAGYAYADCRMLGRDAGPFLPVFSYLYDSHARTQYSFALVVHLWRTPCPFPGAAHLCNAAARGGWFSTMGRSHSVFDLCARTAMVRELLASRLQENAPDSLWNGLIAELRSVFPGTLTYDMNWITQLSQLPSWMKNPLLKMIGFSEYIPLTDAPVPVDPRQLSGLWKEKVTGIIDGLSC